MRAVPVEVRVADVKARRGERLRLDVVTPPARILEDLIQTAKAMDALDAEDGDDRNAANLQVVLDRIRLYDREYSRIVEARKASSS